MVINNKAKNKSTQKITRGIVHIYSSFNNTIITITGLNGESVSWSSAGHMGFKGSRKNTAFAAQKAAEDAATKAIEHGMSQVDVCVKGPGAGRESAIRALTNCGLSVLSIKDVSPIVHNGCKPPKMRRI